MAVASQVTPVPGGVGSLTTAILMGNVLKAMKIQGVIK
ncbi:Bifunctional protein FolD protein [bioreactor metagenome]|uniref:Bifunctional protein FolD protein n=1 Tax=bioreactor metagenome TaxID=1076179 RepID=A0A645ID14_9ZZZZ